MVKVFLKIVAGVLTGFALLLLLAFFILQTTWFKERAKEYLVTQANRHLQGVVQVDRLEGNFFNHLTFRNVLVQTGVDTLLFVPRLSVWYNVWSLRRGELQLDSLEVQSPRTVLRQHADGSWNFQHLLVRDTVNADTTDRKFSGKIRLSHFIIRDGALRLVPERPPYPTSLENLSLHLSGWFRADSQMVWLKHLRFRAREPEVVLEELSFSLFRGSKGMVLEDVRLKTGRNQLNATGMWREQPSHQAELTVSSAPMDFSEISLFVPALRLPAHPKLNLSLRQIQDSLLMNLKVQEGNQQLHLIGSFRFPKKSNWRHQVAYRLKGQFRNFHLSHWLPRTPSDWQGNGSFLLRGRGMERTTAQLSLQVWLRQCVFSDRQVDSLRAQIEYLQGNMHGTLRASSSWGEAQLNTGIEDVWNQRNARVRLQFRQLHTAPLLQREKWNSVLTGTLLFTGSLQNMHAIQGTLTAQLHNSRLDTLPVDTLSVRAVLEGQYISFPTFEVEVAGARLTGQGEITHRGRLAFSVQGELDSLGAFLPYLPVKPADLGGRFHASVTGPADSLNLRLRMRLNKLRFYSLIADSGYGEVDVQLPGPDALRHMLLRLPHARFGSVPLDSLQLALHPGLPGTELRVHFARSGRQAASVRAVLLRDSLLYIRLPEWWVSAGESRWQGNPEARVEYGQRRLSFHHVELNALTSDSIRQTVRIQGQLNLEGENNWQVQLERIRLSELFGGERWAHLPEEELNLHFGVRGSVRSPEISGQVHVQPMAQDASGKNTLSGEFSYKGDRFRWNLKLHHEPAAELHFSGQLPVSVSLSPWRINWLNQGNVEFLLNARQFLLSSLNPLLNSRISLGGVLEGELAVRNTLQQPIFSGTLSLKQGRLKAHAYHLDYRNINGGIHGDSTRLILDSLQVARGKGSLKIAGFLEMDRSLWHTRFRRATAQLTSQKFPLLQNATLHLVVTSNLQARAAPDSSRFKGTITVDHSVYYLPGFMELLEGEDSRETGVPLLVQATRKIPAKQPQEKPGEVVREKLESVFYAAPFRDFQGTIQVRFPEDSWLKSPNLRVELQGKLDLTKQENELRIQGDIQVVKGNFNFLGKNFRILKGGLHFRGEPELNPEVLLEAEYEFRDSHQNLKTMKLIVSGRLNRFTTHFFLNGKNITQTDAISYIMFGRSREDLLYGDAFSAGENAGGGGNQLLLDMAAGLLSSELTRSLGREFQVDMIEIKAQDNWEQATFVVGKYLTNRLFVSYQRALGNETDDDVARETIRVEYEIVRNLFLQVVEGDAKRKGMDIIFKFER